MPDDYATIERHIAQILDVVVPPEHRDSEHFAATPNRVARAYIDELFAGYMQNPAALFTIFERSDTHDDLVIVADMPVFSTCAHHMLPFTGTATAAYLPGEHLLGLSKFARLVDMYSRRLTVQENITKSVADTLMKHLKPKGVMVMIEASHGCMSCRGAKANGSRTITCALRGVFLGNPYLKAEVLSLIGS